VNIPEQRPGCEESDRVGFSQRVVTDNARNRSYHGTSSGKHCVAQQPPRPRRGTKKCWFHVESRSIVAETFPLLLRL
jgi:hypothetical protein